MKHGVIYFSSAILAALLAAPLVAWADANPDFDDDAKPILKMQPGLLQYVESRFEVKDTGTAKFPGDDDRRPAPPYIFRARPLGSHGPYNLRLLIQPGEPGHILGVVDITKVHINPPASSTAPPPQRASPRFPKRRRPRFRRFPLPPRTSSRSRLPRIDSLLRPSRRNHPNRLRIRPPARSWPPTPRAHTSGQPSLAPPPDPAPPAQ